MINIIYMLEEEHIVQIVIMIYVQRNARGQNLIYIMMNVSPCVHQILKKNILLKMELTRIKCV